MTHTQRDSSWNWSKVNDQILSHSFIRNSSFQPLGFICCEVFFIVYDNLERGPMYDRQLKAQKPALNSLFDSGLGLFSKLFPICCLGLPVWPAHLFPVMSQYSSFHYYASMVVGVNPVWGWACACHAWSNSLFLCVALLEYCYCWCIWMLFEATFMSENTLRGY